MSIYDKLLRNPLFRGLDLATLRHLLEESSYQIKKYPAAAFIAHSGEESAGIHFLLSGLVRTEMSNLSGKVLKVENIEANRVLAPAFIFGPGNRYPVDIIADRDSECFFLIRHVFLRMLRMNETLLKNYLDLISERTQFLSERLRILSLQTIRGKIACYLLDYSEQIGQSNFRLPFSQSYLAEFFGVARPSLTRSLQELRRQGFIQIEGKMIRILDKRELGKLIE